MAAMSGDGTSLSFPLRQEFIEEFVHELTGCARPYVSVHRNDVTTWTAAELGSLAHDVFMQMVEES
jgi:hypothetical protein